VVGAGVVGGAVEAADVGAAEVAGRPAVVLADEAVDVGAALVAVGADERADEELSPEQAASSVSAAATVAALAARPRAAADRADTASRG
jgi:hypothetical protein